MTLKDGEIIALDTMFFIYYFEGQNAHVGKAGKILSRVEKGSLKAVTSVITLSEIMVKPLAENNLELADEYKNSLNSFPHLRVMEINQFMATLAASLKAKYNIKLPDALQVACALFSGAGIFVSNDKRLKKIKEIKVVSMEQL